MQQLERSDDGLDRELEEELASSRGPTRTVIVPETAPELVPTVIRQPPMVSPRLAILVGIFVVGFLVYFFWLSAVPADRDQSLLASQFKASLATGSPPVGPQPVGSPVAILEVERLNVSTVVSEGTDSSVLEAGPGHLRSSVLPGQPGNTILLGRRTTYGGPFEFIGDLALGDPIVLTTAQGAFTYRATGAAIVSNDTPEVILAATPDARLTLVTADPQYTGGERLVLQAVLEGGVAPSTGGQPLGVDSNELGLVGDFSAVPALALSLGLLILTVRKAGRMYVSHPPRAVWAISTPIILALSVLSFSLLAELLPATQ